MLKIFKSIVARAIPFDNQGTTFSSTNVQDAIEEITASASPGFTWGRRGNVSAGTYLINEDVASNRTGRRILIDNPIADRVSIDNDRVTTYTIEFFEHDGNLTNFASIGTLTVTGARGDSFDVSLPLTKDKLLGTRLVSFTGNSPRNIVVGVVIKGQS